LVFPALSSTSCPATAAGDACYQGYDDFGNDPPAISAITFTGTGYDVGGTDGYGFTCYPPIYLGSGGINEVATSAPLSNTLGVPLNPGVDQTWTLTGTGASGSAYLNLSGAIEDCANISPGNVTVNASRGADMVLSGANDFPLTFNGSGPASSVLEIDSGFGLGLDPSTLVVNDASVVLNNDKLAGLTATNSNVIINQYSGLVDVVGDRTITGGTVTLNVEGNSNAVTGTSDFINPAVPLDLSNTALALQWTGSTDCPDETQAVPGDTFTLLTTEAYGLFGWPFTNAPNGSVIPLTCTSTGPGDPAPEFEINYAPLDSTPNRPDTVTATLLGTSSTKLTVDTTTSTAVDEPVTLTATVATGQSYHGVQPALGTVEFDADGAPIGGCGAVPFSSTNPDESSVATCETALPVADSGKSVTATYVPATDPTTNELEYAPSVSSASTLPTITKDPVNVLQAGEDTAVTAGVPVTFQTTIQPVTDASASLASYIFPTGTVTFTVAGEPLTCTGSGDGVVTAMGDPYPGWATASCTTTFSYSGTVTATAAYAGDANFTDSTLTAPPTATISSPASGGTYLIGQVVPTAFSCADAGGPGLRTCGDNNGSTGPTGVLDTSTSGAHTYVVAALDLDGQVVDAVITYTVIGKPTATIGSPSSGAQYTQGEAVSTAFSCADDPNGPGIASCVDSAGARSPGSLDTSTTGSHSYTVTATSADGLTDATTVTYTVVAPAAVTPATAGTSGTLGAGATSVTGTTASVPLTCAGAAAVTCQARLVLSIVETVQGKKVIAVAARMPRKSKKRKVVVVLASKTVTVSGGQKLTVHLQLNAVGKRLLAKHSPLKAKLTITVGSKTIPSTVTFTAHRKTQRKHTDTSA
jgi:hypothetical protein